MGPCIVYASGNWISYMHSCSGGMELNLNSDLDFPGPRDAAEILT
jgi:hypothetical protein